MHPVPKPLPLSYFRRLATSIGYIVVHPIPCFAMLCNQSGEQRHPPQPDWSCMCSTLPADAFVFQSFTFSTVFTKALQGRAWAIDGTTLANVRGVGAANAVDNTVTALQVQVRREAGEASNPSEPSVVHFSLGELIVVRGAQSQAGQGFPGRKFAAGSRPTYSTPAKSYRPLPA